MIPLLRNASSRKRVLLLSERVNALHKYLLLNLPDSLFQVHASIGTSLEQVTNRGIEDIPEDFDLIILNQPGDMAFGDKLTGIISTEIINNRVNNIIIYILL